MIARNALQGRLKRDRLNTDLQDQYRHESNRVKALIQDAEQNYYKKEFYNCKGNTSAAWRLIRNMVPSKKSTSNGYGHGNDLEKAEKLNDLFVTIGKQTFEKMQNYQNHISVNQETLHHHIVHEHLFRPEPVDANTVILTIKHLKNTISVGSDGISLTYEIHFSSPFST